MSINWNSMQTRAVDPFSSYKSSNVNRLSYGISENGRGVIFGLNISFVNSTTFQLTHGVALKDNVVIKWNQTLNISISDLDSYPYSSGSHYIVMAYRYIEDTIENYDIAKIDMIPVANYDPVFHLILGTANVDGSGSITTSDDNNKEYSDSVNNHEMLNGLLGGDNTNGHWHLDQSWYDCLTNGCLNGGASNLNALTDVDTTGEASGCVLSFDGTHWVPTTPTSGGATELDDLSDVDTTGEASGCVLSFDGTHWVPTTPASGGATELNDLSDVDTTGEASGCVLGYNGSSWVPTTVTSGGSGSSTFLDLTDTESPYPTDADGCNNINLVMVNNTCDGLKYIRQDDFNEHLILGFLCDVDHNLLNTNNISDGQVLGWNASNQHWTAIDVSGSGTTLGSLSDVDTTGEVDGCVLGFDGTNWIPTTPTSGSGGASTFLDLTDTASDMPNANSCGIRIVATKEYGNYGLCTCLDFYNICDLLLPVHLRDLGNVCNSNFTDTDGILYYYHSNQEWHKVNPSLSLLCDVDTETNPPSTGCVLGYNGTNWVPTAPTSGGSGGASTFISLTDTSSTYPTNADGQTSMNLVRVNDTCNGLIFVNTVNLNSFFCLGVLQDVCINNINDGQTLVWNSANNNWINCTISSGSGSNVSNLCDLNDVNFPTNPADHEILMYDSSGSVWCNIDLPRGVRYSNVSITDLTDTYGSTTTPANGDILCFDSSSNHWVPTSSSNIGVSVLDDLNDVKTTGANAPSSGDILSFNGTNWIPIAQSSGGSVPNSTEEGQVLLSDANNGWAVCDCFCMYSSNKMCLVDVRTDSEIAVFGKAMNRAIVGCTNADPGMCAIVASAPSGYDFVASGSGTYSVYDGTNLHEGFNGNICLTDISCLIVCGGIIVGTA